MNKVKNLLLLNSQHPSRSFLILLFLFFIIASFLTAYVSIQFKPVNLEIHAGAYRVFSEKGFYDAEKFLSDYIDDNPENIDAWKILFQLRYADDSHNLFLSEESLIRKIEFSPIFSSYVLNAWRLYYMSGEDHAVSYLINNYNNAVLDISPREIEAVFGDLYYESKDYDRSNFHYRNAVMIDPDYKEGRIMVLETLIELKKFKELASLLNDVSYREACDNQCRYKIYLANQDYLNMLIPLWKEMALNYNLPMLISSLITGSAWFMFLIFMGRIFDERKYLVISIFAVVSGVLSTYATIPVLIFMQNHLTFHMEGGDILRNLLYAIVDIGMREELMKLLFFLPFVPFLYRTKNHLAILTVASCVGLGFAIEENINYFEQGGGESVLGRFLTANFFHMTLTGYCGYYLIMAFQKGGEEWSRFMIETVKMVVVHGLYDFLLIEKRLGALSFLAMTVYIWISREYLRLILGQDIFRTRKVSLTFIFVLSLSITTSVAIFLSVTESGLLRGFIATGSNLLGLALVTIMFFKEFNEPLR